MRRLNYDLVLVLATTAVLFMISILCIGSMFYFKWAGLELISTSEKMVYQASMNSLLSPLLAALLLILSICIPKRLLPPRWLHAVVAMLGLITAGISLRWGWPLALLVVLFLSAVLQVLVLFLVLMGRRLHFHCEGYWNRLGSSLVHLGLVLFCIDFLLFRYELLHLALFWTTTTCIFLGAVLAFYGEGMITRMRSRSDRRSPSARAE